MKKPQTSSKVSSIAGKVLAGKTPTRAESRTLAASALRQDERKGQSSSKKKR